MPTGSEAEVEAAPEELTLLRIQDALFDALEFVRAGAMATGGLKWEGRYPACRPPRIVARLA